ncbi:hypothetical protein J5I95_15720 [Candidatus Poribacteria bacterium]|nr:hypothetical protein [Candidatus Poribacteria bacterium]
MKLHKGKLPLQDMTHKQLREWLLPIVEHTLFLDREKILELLTIDADRDTLTEAFREFFEAYYYDVAFELDRHEKNLLSVLDSCDTYVSLKHRVVTVESRRKASPIGREVRRMGSYLPDDPVPRIKISALSNDDFREFLHTLVSSESDSAAFPFFAAYNQVVKLLSVGWTDAEDMPLREAVYEFFVCHLELEQFLEDYAYDPDEGLEIRPKVAEELEQSITDHESGEVKGRPLQEVAKETDLSDTSFKHFASVGSSSV